MIEILLQPINKGSSRGFFECSPTTVLDPGQITSSFSADQMIQFARAVALEVTFASYGLLEELLMHARSFGALGARGQLGRSPFRSIIGSAVGTSVASLSWHSLPIASSFIGTALSEDAVQTDEIQQCFVVGSGSADVPIPVHWVKTMCH